MQKRDKKGVSPVVATILLVAIAIILALIIFVWIKSIIGESITKFDGQNAETLCAQLEFDATYYDSSQEISIFNSGSIPIYDFEVFIKKTGSHQTINLKYIDTWPKIGLRSGDSFEGVLGPSVENANEIILIPILRGTGTSSGQIKTVVCKQNNGISIFKK